MSPRARKVCFLCGEDKPIYRKGLCEKCWHEEQARLRWEEEDAL